MNIDRQNPPSKQKILQYWLNSEQNSIFQTKLFNVQDNQFISCCWSCGLSTSVSDQFSNLQTCHIIPHSLGGSNLEENYVLMCPTCHSEAPNINSFECFFDWFVNKESFYTSISKDFLKLSLKHQDLLLKIYTDYNEEGFNEIVIDTVKDILLHHTSTHGSVMTSSTRSSILLLTFNILQQRFQ